MKKNYSIGSDSYGPKVEIGIVHRNEKTRFETVKRNSDMNITYQARIPLIKDISNNYNTFQISPGKQRT